MSARFLITCWPFTGHVFGQLAVAEELRRRGHHVAFYTGPSAAPTIERAGFELLPFRHLDEQQAYRAVRVLESQDPRRPPAPRTVARTFRSWLVDTIPDQLADLGPVLHEWRPDVLVTDLSLWGPIVVLSETSNVPVALSSTFLGPLIPGPDAPAWGFGMRAPRGPAGRMLARAVTRTVELFGTGLRHRVDEIRAGHALPPLGCSVNAFTARLPLYLVGNVRELDYRRRDLPDTVHYVGDTLWHPPETPETKQWLDAVPTDRPWVHLSEGTLHTGDPFLLKAAVAGLQDAAVEVVATTGGHRDPAAIGLGTLPANVHLRRWVGHAELLPRCAAVVTAGGAATILSALRAGVPLVVVPTTWDKPDNARRVVDAGVGVRLAPRRCTPAAVHAAVERVLSEPRYRLAAQHMARLLRDAPGTAGAADLLEALIPARRETHVLGRV